MCCLQAAADAARLGRLGVKVLPDGSPVDPERGSPATERDAARTSATSSLVMQSEVPASTGRRRDGSGSSEDSSPKDGKTERSKFKMGISGFGFKKQKSKTDVEGEGDAGDVAAKGETEERSKKGNMPAINMKLPKLGGSKPVFENDKYVKKDEEEVEPPQPMVVEVEKIKSAMSANPVRKPSASSSASSSDVDAIELDPSMHGDGSDKKDSKSKSWGLKNLKKGLGLGKKSDSDEKDRRTSSDSDEKEQKASSGSSSGEETKEPSQADIPPEMRLAAGVAQERRNRRNRQQSASSSSSEDDKKVDQKPISPQPIEVEVKVADKPLSSLADEKLEVQEDVQKEVRKVETDVENVEIPRAEMDKLQVLKEVLSMTPAREVRRKAPAGDELEDVVSETVERSTVHRSTESLSADGVPRITGEVTGLVEVGARRGRPPPPGSPPSSAGSSSDEARHNTASLKRAKKRRKRRSDSGRSSSSAERGASVQLSSDDEKQRPSRLPGTSPALPLSSTEISIDTSSTEPLNTSTPVKLSAGDERDRKCASMGRPLPTRTRCARLATPRACCVARAPQRRVGRPRSGPGGRGRHSGAAAGPEPSRPDRSLAGAGERSTERL